MNNKTRNFSEAIDDLENHSKSVTQNLRAKLQEELHRLEEKMEDLKPHLDEVKKAKSKVENQVKDNPWAAVGLVGLVFFILGFLFGSKRSRGSD